MKTIVSAISIGSAGAAQKGLGAHLRDAIAEHVDGRIRARGPRRDGVDTDPVGAAGRCPRAGEDSSAALVARYTVAAAKLAEAAAVETLTVAPDPRAIIFGRSAAVRKNGPRTLMSSIMSTRVDVPAPAWARTEARPRCSPTHRSHRPERRDSHGLGIVEFHDNSRVRARLFANLNCPQQSASRMSRTLSR
ncbi:MAG: hypothetical protein QOG14_2702 [Mycobacterium sp.]|jgi:hypothetical protein|nr:hypothetical protein [Mycobacterium sp.]